MEQNNQQTFTVATIAALFLDDLLDKLALVQCELGGEVYLVGGSVRDLVLGRVPGDLDLTVVRNAEQWAERLRQLTGGTYVELGREEGAARVVLRQGLEFFKAGGKGWQSRINAVLKEYVERRRSVSKVVQSKE